eukprot:4452-Pleurochrysis_carterae.AAC.3
MVVSTITHNHFPPVPVWSLQVRSRKYKLKGYTPDEGVRGSDWVAVTARSDRAVTNGGIAVVYMRDFRTQVRQFMRSYSNYYSHMFDNRMLAS